MSDDDFDGQAWKALQPVIDRIVPLAFHQGLAKLSPAERDLYLVWSYSGEVCNGGHAQFFFNSAADFAHETVQALQAVGAPSYARLLQASISVFPKATVPRDLEERNEVFNALPEAAHVLMRELDDDFLKLGDDRLMEVLLSHWRSIERSGT